MNPRNLKQSKHLGDEKTIFFERSLSTGVLNWQELGHLDFKDLVDQTHRRNTFIEEQDDE